MRILLPFLPITVNVARPTNQKTKQKKKGNATNDPNDPKALFSVGFISEQMRVIRVDLPQPLRPQILALGSGPS